MSDLLPRRADRPQEVEIETLRSALSERFGPDFVALVSQMGLLRKEHLLELLDARADEQDQLAMAWIRAATMLEAEWASQSRRQGGEGVGLARYLEIRLPSPRQALAAQRAEQQREPTAEPPPPKPPTPLERESAQRRIRLETAIAEARTTLLRVDALDRLVEADRQAIIGQLEDLISLISRRLEP